MDDLPFLVQCTKDMERVQEFLDLVKRGDAKVNPDSGPTKPVYGDKVKESPLKVLSFLLKTRKGRPEWTKQLNWEGSTGVIPVTDSFLRNESMVKAFQGSDKEIMKQAKGSRFVLKAGTPYGRSRVISRPVLGSKSNEK
jgi:hypothetical protein